MDFWTSKESTFINKVNKFNELLLENNNFIIKCNTGILKIIFYTDEIFQIIYSCSNKFLEIPSFAIIKKAEKNLFISNTENNDFFIINSKSIFLKFKKSTGEIIIETNNEIISKINEISWERTIQSRFITSIEFESNSSNHHYGLGEKYGFLYKKGREYMMWNTDQTNQNPTKDPLYKSIPFLINHNSNSINKTYGLFLDKTCASWFDLKDKNSFKLKTNDFEFDLFFINGLNIKDIIKNYTYLTGKINLPPIWSLGYQQCRWSYFPESKVKNIAKTFRELKIPCDVIYLDIDYMDDYRVFSWNLNRFPNPQKLINNLNNDGFKTIVIIDPGVKKDPDYEIYKEGIENDYFCKYIDKNIFHGKVWPGKCAFPDFTKKSTQSWWAKKHKDLFKLGISGIWNDMNEPSNFKPFDNSGSRISYTVPNDVILENNKNARTFSKYHNIYANCMCESTLIAFENYNKNKRPFILSRAAYAGIQRYSALWTGDNSSWWEHLETSIPMCLNIGMSGVPFVGSDVGGFHENADAELFIRWIQLGVFIPLFRGHSEFNSNDHEPWSFGENALKIIKKYIELRYKLIPYLYNEFYNTSKSGLPIMKPLILEYPFDNNVINLNDEFLFGENILVCPVTKPSIEKKSVYIPEGIWYNFWTGKKLTGKSYVIINSPIDTIPIFIKESTLLPLAPVMNYTQEKIIETLKIKVYPGNGKYEFYEDDGITNDYKLNKFNLISFETNNNNNYLFLKIQYLKRNYSSDRKNFEFEFINTNIKPKNIILNNTIKLQYSFKSKNLKFLIDDNNLLNEVKIEF
jgi:alpha-glucosidase